MNRPRRNVSVGRLLRIGGEVPPLLGLRSLAVMFGLLLMGSYLSVFYRVTAVAGDVRLLVFTVGSAVVLATLFARRIPERTGLKYGALLVAVGVISYLVFVPELHDFLFTVDFVVNWLAYLSGRSVLRFLSVDIWAISVAPGPAFLTWYLLLSRRYDLAAISGGLMLGFFVLTSDADQTTALVGMISLLGLLGLDMIEETNGVRRQVEQLGFVLAVATLAARLIRIVPDNRSKRSPAGSGGNGQGPITGSLDDTDGRAHIFGSISLSPTVQFTAVSDTPVYWHVAAYDRYTGRDWIRTGRPESYDRTLESPPGETIPLEQRIRIERSMQAMPAAWKPVEVSDAESIGVQVTGSGGLRADESLSLGDSYTVISEIPEAGPDQLRDAGTDYPEAVREQYLQIPGNTRSKIQQLTDEVAGDAETPYGAATAIVRWLERNKEYSLSVSPPGEDIAASFLRSMDRGYCVYYTTAMAIMLRVLEIPARFVLGYTPGNGDDEKWTVRGIHSHAWVEVYFPDIGWISFDPTPAEPRRADEQSRLRNATDIRGGPRDPSDPTPPQPSNRATITDAKTGTPPQTRNESGPTESRRTEIKATTGTPSGRPFVNRIFEAGADHDRISIVALLTALIIGGRWAGLFDRIRHGFSVRRQKPTASPKRDIENAYERLERLLTRSYRQRRDSETPRQYLGAIGLDDERTRRVVELYEQAKYSGTVSRSNADEAIELVDELVSDH